MGLSAQAILDAQQILENPEDFGVSITLVAPNEETAVVVGFSRKHHTAINPATGGSISSKSASVTISEGTILAANANYPIRDNDPESKFYQEVRMIDHLVDVADSTGVVKKYSVFNSYPDEKLGWIVLILEDYEPDPADSE